MQTTSTIKGGCDDSDWKTVERKKRKMIDAPPSLTEVHSSHVESAIAFFKKKEACWYYNTNGCYRKDGSVKPESECKYQHVLVDPSIVTVMKSNPPFSINKKPCFKYNLEGYCSWGDACNYSHRTLSDKEFNMFYPKSEETTQLQRAQHKHVEHTEHSQQVTKVVKTPITQPNVNIDTKPLSGESPKQVDVSPQEDDASKKRKHTRLAPKSKKESKVQESPTETLAPTAAPDASLASSSLASSSPSPSSPPDDKKESIALSIEACRHPITTQVNFDILSRLADLESRLSLLDFKLKCSDDHCEKRFILLKSTIMNQHFDIQELLNRN
jgi:hypothetical protein